MTINCRHCGFVPEKESELHLHHIIPKEFEGKDIDGRVYLCKSCHKLIHAKLPKNKWEFQTDKKKFKDKMFTISEEFIGKKLR